MLEDLKKEAAASGRGMELARLTMFVAACVAIAGLIVIAQTCSQAGGEAPPETVREDGDEQDVSSAPARIDPEVLAPLVHRTVADPDGGTRTVETLGSYVTPAVSWMRQNVQGEPSSAVATRLAPESLAARPFDEALGRVFEVEGEVVELVEQRWATESGRLWTAVLRGPDGGLTLCVKHGLASDVGGGAPRDAYRHGGARRPIQVGQYVLVRGYYLQRRTGTVGRTILADPTPALWSVAFRRRKPPSQRVEPIPSLEEVDWVEVRDRTMGETERWDQDQLFQVVQWARHVGYEEIRRRIASGEVDAESWDQATFSAWQDEVVAEAGEARPFTEGARGRWFSTTGLIGNWAHVGWESVRRNVWGVDGVFLIDLKSDFYGNWTIRTVSAFPMTTYEEIEGERAEHVRLYGIFYKNYTYEPRSRSESGRKRPLTMPMFIVMHAEPVVYDVSSSYQRAMTIIAAVIAVLGFLFYFLFVRSESREAAALERRRIARRRAARARSEEGAVDAPPEPPREAADDDLGPSAS